MMIGELSRAAQKSRLDTALEPYMAARTYHRRAGITLARN